MTTPLQPETTHVSEDTITHRWRCPYCFVFWYEQDFHGKLHPSGKVVLSRKDLDIYQAQLKEVFTLHYLTEHGLDIDASFI